MFAAARRSLFLRSTPLILLFVASFVLGLVLAQPAAADPPDPTARGHGLGGLTLRNPFPAARLPRDALPVSPALKQQGIILSETFEGAWPSAGWQVMDADQPPSANGEYFWSRRTCKQHTGSASAFAVGGGANGASLPCTANYPNRVNSWMIYGPMDFSQAQTARLSYYYWLNSRCDGSNCATASDPLEVFTSADGGDWHLEEWWAGNWHQDPSADANGWVRSELNLSHLVGASQVWVAFAFRSGDLPTYPHGASVDDILIETTECAPTATIHTLTTDRDCYAPGATAGVFVNVGTSLPSQPVKVTVRLWSGDVIWASQEVNWNAPQSGVIPLPIPTNLANFPGDYSLVVTVEDASSGCLQARAERTIRVDPNCGTVTPVVSLPQDSVMVLVSN
ncbi:MAG: hypothetical protein KIS91_18600, partial [Anaerolineae bacterium]|nr:hypothetical protein [Anaerolineae bacterium]